MSNFILRTSALWGTGFALSLVGIWGVTAVFTPNPVPETWSAALKRNVRPEGWTVRERSEGWANSRIGAHGLVGVSREELASNEKIVIWGDSFVEATQVADSLKMHRQFGALISGSAPGLTAVPVGERWWSVPDYLFRIPDYEAVLGGVRLHVIHLNSLEDTFPDQYPGGRVSLFLSEPGFRLEKWDNEIHELEGPAHIGAVSALAHHAHLQFFMKLKRQGSEVLHLKGLRFQPGTYRPPVAKDSHREWNRYLRPEWGAAEPPREAWRYLLGELDAVTTRPILFVYVPPVPTVAEGRVVLDNPEANLVESFETICRDMNLGFVNAAGPFREFFEETGRFPNGFHNSRPWEGHYNADGHRLVAGAIADWIQQNRHVVYPD